MKSTALTSLTNSIHANTILYITTPKVANLGKFSYFVNILYPKAGSKNPRVITESLAK